MSNTARKLEYMLYEIDKAKDIEDIKGILRELIIATIDIGDYEVACIPHDRRLYVIKKPTKALQNETKDKK
mgnify:CR=1 FL=1|tara:strand:- start:245 stop:457 length:213 start_codon:yes stop_codon:yes gene_type:complete